MPRCVCVLPRERVNTPFGGVARLPHARSVDLGGTDWPAGHQLLGNGVLGNRSRPVAQRLGFGGRERW
jgi:hypothetical protein